MAFKRRLLQTLHLTSKTDKTTISTPTVDPLMTNEPAKPVAYECQSLHSPTAVVHHVYDLNSLPPKEKNHTRFVCISDTHGRTFDVPPGDVLLHSGDITNTGMLDEFKMDWLCAMPHAVKIMIAGNHDLSLHNHDGWYDANWKRWDSVNRKRGKQDVAKVRELLVGPRACAAGIVYLQDELHTFSIPDSGREWTVYGSPWQPAFGDWAFNYERGEEAEARIQAFPFNDAYLSPSTHSPPTHPPIDILLTHGPPYGILDETRGDELVGCESLRKHLPRMQPRLHAFGHIHEAHGVEIRKYTVSDNSGDTLSPPLYVGEGESDENNALRGTKTGITGETIFVNAANWPASGKLGRVGKVPFGTGRFAPVVVDLRN